MKMLIMFIDALFLVPSLFFALYLALLTFLAMVRKPERSLRPPTRVRRFVILVPAHNEEAVIGQTLLSMWRLDYPRDHFDIIVIADNCTDMTAKLSRSHGATVYERVDGVNKGKGRALRWCIDTLESESKNYDAIVIIDADTTVSPNLLSVMNRYLEDGAECIQCSDLVATQPGAWSPEVTRLAFILHNYVRPLGKMALGLSTGLNGNGMCFSKELIARMPWSSYSRVEDLEHGLQLVLNGVKVQFAPEAVVHATMPADSRTAVTQRRRWELARYSVVRKYAGRLLYEAVRNRSIVILDMLVDLVTPAFVTLFLATTVMVLLHAAAEALGATWLTGFLLLSFIALLLEMFHVLGGLRAARADRRDYLILANFPRYIRWKLSVYLRALLGGDDKEWIRTERSNRLAH